MKPVALMLLLIFMALAFAGCTSQTPVQPPTPSPTSVPAVTTTPAPTLSTGFTGRWVLQKFGVQDGSVVTNPTTEISLYLNQDGSLSGWGGCNNYFGTYALTGVMTPKGEGMAVTTTGSTKKYCQDYSRQEDQFLAILGKTMAYSGEADRMTITASTGDALVFRRSTQN